MFKMKRHQQIVLTTVTALLFVCFAHSSLAAVLFEQSKVGVPYDIYQNKGMGSGFYSRYPNYAGSGTLYPGGGVAYVGTAEWLRVKRISGVSCDMIAHVGIYATDALIQIGTVSPGIANGPYCDFQMSGPNRTDMAVGYIGICANSGCDAGYGPLFLDGSPENDGYTSDGTQTIWEKGGWAFQICDAGGCSGGFGSSSSTTTSTSTAAATPPTATSTPQGASNILFLPGIQASRLYKQRTLGLGEDQLWPPSALFDNDVKDLSMSEAGVSDKDIYTRDIVDTTTGVGSIYGGFEAFMDKLKADGKIKDWSPYAYDWRYSVTDIAKNGTHYIDKNNNIDEIKNAANEVEQLASSSFSGKVTIIGHSNGGLLAKAVTQRLEAEGKANLIDKIILLASPQIGTPKAIGTILHGYDQADSLGGIVISQTGAREVINNLPGAYGLLPSQKYFDGLDVPLVTFSNDTATAPYRAIYGNSVSNYSDIVRFIKGDDGLDRRLNQPGSTPVRANGTMFDSALSMHNIKLDNWVAPTGIEVTEIVGTGLPTMKAVEYRGITETKCVSGGPAGGQICTPEAEIKPYAQLTHYGDGTVVQRSAEAYGGVKKKYFVNLNALDNTGGKYEHYNITEATPVQTLLGNILISTTTKNNQYVSDSYTPFNDQYDVEIIDSPVRLLATDTQGNQTGVVVVSGEKRIKQDIPGSQYFEFGDTKYFVVPKGTNRTTILYGEANGGYTLTTATLGTNDTQAVQTILKNATTTPQLIAKYSNKNGIFSTVVTDSNGDGKADYETTLTGTIINKEVPVTYLLLTSTIEKTALSKDTRQILLTLVKSAEYYGNITPAKPLYRNLEDVLLKTAQELTKFYVTKRYISVTDGAAIQKMMQVLIDKR
jgi:pimeloyl-ACP methyl ester carboxylesterase